jgi:glycogen debranching enzyme
MNFHWERGLLLEEGCAWSDESPHTGAIAHLGELPYHDHQYQVTWLDAARCIVKDFAGKPVELYATEDVAVGAVEATVRAAGHTVYGV